MNKAFTNINSFRTFYRRTFLFPYINMKVHQSLSNIQTQGKIFSFSKNKFFNDSYVSSNEGETFQQLFGKH
jgi:hypothetical protein